jgi:membrane associated rhomboid family serine protease
LGASAKTNGRLVSPIETSPAAAGLCFGEVIGMWTLIVLGITCVISMLAFNNKQMMTRGMMIPLEVNKRGEYYRFISYGFLHADGMHLLFNMITLYFFGQYIESALGDIIGDFGFIIFYLGGLVVSILPSYAMHKNDSAYASLGASGAVSAVLFAFILMNPWATIGVFFIPMPAIVFAVLYTAYSIWMDKKGGDNINHSAHLWGAGYGIAFMLIMRPQFMAEFMQKLIPG